MDKNSFRKLFKKELSQYKNQVSRIRLFYYLSVIAPIAIMAIIYYAFQNGLISWESFYIFLDIKTKSHVRFSPRMLNIHLVRAAFVVIGTMLLFISTILFKKYLIGLKIGIIRPLLEALFPNYNYRMDSSIKSLEINDLDLFKERASDFKSQDEMSGEIEGHKFLLAELDMKRDKQIFRGLVLKIEINTSFKEEFILGARGKVISNGRKRIQLNDIFLRKKYNCFSNISSPIQEDLLNLIAKITKWARRSVYVYIDDSKVYFFFPQKRDLLEPQLVGDIVNYKDVQVYKKYFSIIDDVIRLFNKSA